MSQESLENFGAYRLAMELFDLVVEDMGIIAILGILSKTIVSLRRKVSPPAPRPRGLDPL